MSDHRQWLELGLDDLPPKQAGRIRLFRLLLSRAALLRLRLDRALAPSGITTQQGAMLQWIEAQTQAPTIGEVAQALGMSHQNVKQIAAALERKQFLRIEVDGADRRVRRLVLTEQHRRFWQQRNAGDFALVEAWTAVWTDDEVAQMSAWLARLE